MARFGIPLRITTDQGRQFEAELFKRLMQITGSTHLRTTAYHPAANGLVERFHRQLKTAIKCHQTENWVEILPVILMGIRAAWKEDLQATTAEMVYGEPIKLPGQFLQKNIPEVLEENQGEVLEELRKNIQKLKPQEIKRHGGTTTFIFKDMRTTTHVFVRNETLGGGLRSPYEGSYKVLKRNEKVITINKNGKNINVYIDRVKPAYILEEDNILTNQQKITDKPQPEKLRTRSGRTSKPPVRFQIPN
ncbi:uncharacterized protein LOC112639982 [Camponotus floridanus]|uniref:uncharacterized protein LOC112639982 n=1 Tax=Camponotus floridanus TaxID=104421 RepID=UPI000DC69839|nr:uncharacterized protein LOC112639982 [Camponotus floridanus]